MREMFKLILIFENMEIELYFVSPKKSIKNFDNNVGKKLLFKYMELVCG
jgi:hypothetical protein